ncbi:aldo/keto reductase [Mucilaginibacter boryungensis]|uniref:Aldo/keto reductase n=1 Tax=Mucilaginibacter boryungensis TaxID=768480 RepID=A0ABR9XE54_9SPHI|nr:aldo/keto reductase [Mucilaginibacter boryungensis]MBE9665673.1 aldo/keto reductase [Mucilaginibacter boryungensis]
MNNTITIGKDTANPLTVPRLGYGTMRLTGEGFYGEPPNRPEALAILKRAIEKGVRFIDTADYYGDDVTNRLIAEAIYPYPDDLVICTKVGATRKPDKSWVVYNTPENLRTSIENNLRTLKIDRITQVHFRVMPGMTNFEEGMEAMFKIQSEGKILHVGVSNVTRDELQTAMKMGNVVSVENMYGHGQRTTKQFAHGGTNMGGEEVLDICEQHNIVMVPFWSLHTADRQDTRLAKVAQKYGVTEAQVNIAWLLHKSPIMLPIPGTSSLAHFEENLAAADINLSKDDMTFLE